MSPDLDRESTAAVDALVYRLRNRGDGEGQFATDDEPFAQEYVIALRARGWRPTEARAPWDYRQMPHGDGLPTSREAQQQVEETRRALADAAIRRRTLAANPPRGDVA
jgi:hypothetical protein